LISPTSPEVLFNALPLVRRGLALVIAVLRNSEVVKRSGAIPFVTLYVLGDDAGAGAKSMDGSISFIQKLTTMVCSYCTRMNTGCMFIRKFQ